MTNVRPYASTFVLTITAALVFPAVTVAGEIHEAVRSGRLQEVGRLLESRPILVGARDEKCQTPLHIAVQRGNKAIATLLLEKGADPNAATADKLTPLHLVNGPEIAGLLLAHHANVNASDAFGRNPLNDFVFRHAGEFASPVVGEPPSRTAERKRSQATAKLLLDAGATYDLDLVCQIGDAVHARALIEKDPSLGRNFELMLRAVRMGHATIVKLLLEYGADLDQREKESISGWLTADEGRVTLAYHALQYVDVLKLLLDAGADLNVDLEYHGHGWGPSYSSLLHAAAAHGTIECIDLLIAKGMSPNRRDCAGWTPLHVAAFRGREDVVRLLIARGADPTVKVYLELPSMASAAGLVFDVDDPWFQNEYFQFPSAFRTVAARGIERDVVAMITMHDIERLRKTLHENPALLKSTTVDGKTPLQRAVDFGDPDAVIALLDAGADLNFRDKAGDTALHSAAFWGREAITRILIEHNANVSAVNRNYWTPLHESARFCTVAVARLLLAHGASPHVKDADGRTPIDIARGNLERKHRGDGTVPTAEREMFKLLTETAR